MGEADAAGAARAPGAPRTNMIEIEIKAWLDDFDGARRALEAMGAVALGEVVKRDLYYGPERKDAREIDLRKDPVFRLRSEGDAWLVTAKRREMEDGVETNEEVEFAVSNAAAFREFAQRIGFRPFVVKRKKALRYEVGRAIVELSRVDPLGDFVEIEVLLDDGASPDERAAAEREVRGLLARIGVPESRVEPRLYVDMIRKLGTGRPR